METSLSPDTSTSEFQEFSRYFKNKERLLQSLFYLLTASWQTMAKPLVHDPKVSAIDVYWAILGQLLPNGLDFTRSWSGSCLYSKLLCLAIRINNSNIYTCRSQVSEAHLPRRDAT